MSRLQSLEPRAALSREEDAAPNSSRVTPSPGAPPSGSSSTWPRRRSRVNGSRSRASAARVRCTGSPHCHDDRLGAVDARARAARMRWYSPPSCTGHLRRERNVLLGGMISSVLVQRPRAVPMIGSPVPRGTSLLDRPQNIGHVQYMPGAALVVEVRPSPEQVQWIRGRRRYPPAPELEPLEFISDDAAVTPVGDDGDVPIGCRSSAGPATPGRDGGCCHMKLGRVPNARSSIPLALDDYRRQWGGGAHGAARCRALEVYPPGR